MLDELYNIGTDSDPHLPPCAAKHERVGHLQTISHRGVMFITPTALQALPAVR